MKGVDLPAWLQAFAAIVALGISVWATLKSTDLERRRDRLKVRGLAVAVYPELLKFPTMIEGATRWVEQLRQNDRVLIHSVVDNLLSCQIAVPPMMERNIDSFFLLGEPAGATCLHLVSLIDQYNTLVQSVAARAIPMDAGQWHAGMDFLVQHLDLLGRVVVKAQHEVKPLHDAVRG